MCQFLEAYSCFMHHLLDSVMNTGTSKCCPLTMFTQYFDRSTVGAWMKSTEGQHCLHVKKVYQCTQRRFSMYVHMFTWKFSLVYKVLYLCTYSSRETAMVDFYVLNNPGKSLIYSLIFCEKRQAITLNYFFYKELVPKGRYRTIDEKENWYTFFCVFNWTFNYVNMLCSHRTEFGLKQRFQDSMDTIHLDQLFGLQWGTSEALDKIFTVTQNKFCH